MAGQLHLPDPATPDGPVSEKTAQDLVAAWRELRPVLQRTMRLRIAAVVMAAVCAVLLAAAVVILFFRVSDVHDIAAQNRALALSVARQTACRNKASARRAAYTNERFRLGNESQQYTVKLFQQIEAAIKKPISSAQFQADLRGYLSVEHKIVNTTIPPVPPAVCH